MALRLILALTFLHSLVSPAHAVLPSRCAWISSGLVGQGLIRNPLRSEWGKKVFQTSNSNTQVFYRAQDRLPLQLPAEPDSVSALDSELAAMAVDFESWFFSPQAKFNGIEYLNIESQIEIADWQEWYDFRSQLYNDFKNSFLDRLEMIKPSEKYEYIAFFSDFEKRVAFANPRRVRNLKSIAEAAKVLGGLRSGEYWLCWRIKSHDFVEFRI